MLRVLTFGGFFKPGRKHALAGAKYTTPNSRVFQTGKQGHVTNSMPLKARKHLYVQPQPGKDEYAHVKAFLGLCSHAV